MYISRVQLKNWKNFRDVDVVLQQRTFIIGPNASGKSNFLDALRFLHEIASPGRGGLQAAVERRGGFRQIRSLWAHGSDNAILIAIELSPVDKSTEVPICRYELELHSDDPKALHAIIKRELAVVDGETKRRRTRTSAEDAQTLSQTELEYAPLSAKFRPIPDMLASIQYLHLVPQLLRSARDFHAMQLPGDPFGQGFLDRVMQTRKSTREARLRRIKDALAVSVHDLEDLRAVRNEKTGQSHLEARFRNWRSRGTWQAETRFSDGTLRLIALLWALQESDGPLLLEEPELSLNSSIVRRIPATFARVGKRSGRQVIASTHSPDMVYDEGISPKEFAVITQTNDGSTIEDGSQFQSAVEISRAGGSAGDYLLARATERSTMSKQLLL